MSFPIHAGHFFWCRESKGASDCGCRMVGYTFALGIALGAGVFELIKGTNANSSAMWSDALHMITDAAAYLVFIFSAFMMYRGNSEEKADRYDQIGGLTGALFLVGVAIALLVYSGKQIPVLLQGVSVFIDIKAMIWVPLVTALGSFLILVVLRALGLSHDPSHKGHDHTHDMAVWHVAGDLLVSIAVSITGAIALALPTFAGWINVVATIALSAIFLVVAMKKIISIVPKMHKQL